MVKKHLLEKLKDLKCDIDKIEHKLIPKAKIEEFNRLLAEIKDVLGEKVDMLVLMETKNIIRRYRLY